MRGGCRIGFPPSKAWHPILRPSRLNIDLARFENRFAARENDEITEAVIIDWDELDGSTFGSSRA